MYKKKVTPQKHINNKSYNDNKKSVNIMEKISIKMPNVNNLDVNSDLDSKFYTESSKNIPQKLIILANNLINRHESISLLNNYLLNQNISENVEKSIYEFALVHITINNLMHNFIEIVYRDKLRDIISNIDGNTKINNLTLKQNIIDGSLNPRLIAFLAPEQLHPKRWEDILKKQMRRIETENNMATTDIYTCKKCGEKKFRLTEFQTRGADEPTTKFLTCMVCYATFTK
jgi:DNA-directed RNA polymerase subunit M/transcription elongation factor TFIIS